MYNRATTLFHNHRIPGWSHDHMIDLVIPQLEKTGSENNNIPRWKDDGGPVFESYIPRSQTNGADTKTRSTPQVSSRTQPQLVKINHSVLNQNKSNLMNKKVGLWLNHNKAVIVSIANKVEGKRIITSDRGFVVLDAGEFIHGQQRVKSICKEIHQS